MITTITPNAAVDKTYRVEDFQLDRVHRPQAMYTVPGGKGINVSRVTHEMGRETLASGFVGGNNGRFIVEGLKKEGIPNDFVWVKEESRTAIAIIDPLSQTQTEVNENGPNVTSEEVQELRDKFENFLNFSDIIVFCGSLPPGVPYNIYAEFIECANQRGVKTILDGSGLALKLGIEKIPYMVKPNIFELEALTGEKLESEKQVAEVAKDLIDKGMEIVVVTLGKQGAIIANRQGAWRGIPPEVPFVSAVGSGDALAAEFAIGIVEGWEIEEAIRFGIAAGAANSMVYGAGFCKKEDIERLKEEVKLYKIL